MAHSFENLCELTELELADACGGFLKDYCQHAVNKAMHDAGAAGDNHLLCNPDTALMNTNGTLTSNSAGCIW